MQWQYRTIRLAPKGFLGAELDETALDDFMNTLGNEGWELVTAFDTNRTYGETRDVVAVFKRPASRP